MSWLELAYVCIVGSHLHFGRIKQTLIRSDSKPQNYLLQSKSLHTVSCISLSGILLATKLTSRALTYGTERVPKHRHFDAAHPSSAFKAALAAGQQVWLCTLITAASDYVF